MYKEEEPSPEEEVVMTVMGSDMWNKPYSFGEVTWGVILILGIFAINIAVLWVVSRSRELWKPRHLWMACLCVTDLFVGGHKALELLLLALPQRELCVLQRATLGIPYVVNMLLLTLLSLDRFVAVRYPFFYSSSVSNKHVAVGFFVVLVAGTVLAGATVTIGLHDPICRAQSLQLVYLTIVLAICSVLTLFFNSAVLRIAKKQLNAIYAQEPSIRGRRRVSVVCTNCGYKNETYVNTLLPPGNPSNTATAPNGVIIPMRVSSEDLTSTTTCAANHVIQSINSPILPLSDPVVIGPLDVNNLGHSHCDPSDHSASHLLDETTTPLVRTVSLPTIPDTLSVPISLVVQPDPAIPPAVVVGNYPAEVDLGCKMTSMSQLNDPSNDLSISGNHLLNNNTHVIPRSRSLVTCQTHRIIPQNVAVPRLQLFRNLHFARAHMFHVGRLFPSIRFARTVLLIMIPMWVFILPIVTIIPLHRGCEDGNKSELNCDLVETLWRYLVVHMRSILPLQAILDTLIYAFGSKEFRQALMKIVRRRKQSK